MEVELGDALFKISPSLFAPEGHFTQSADSLIKCRRILLSTHSMGFLWQRMHERTRTNTHFSPRVIPQPRHSKPQIKLSSPTQWTPRKQFGSQLAAEVVNNHQITVAGTFVENLTPRSSTESLRSGELHTKRCTGEKARAGGELTATPRQKCFTSKYVAHAHTDTQTQTHTHTHRHTDTHTRVFC